MRCGNMASLLVKGVVTRLNSSISLLANSANVDSLSTGALHLRNAPAFANVLVTDSSARVQLSNVTLNTLTFLNGVTGPLQAQLDSKPNASGGELYGTVRLYETPSRALVTNATSHIVSSLVTSTELATLSGITSNVQAQLDTKQPTIVGAASSATTANLTASKVVVSDAQGKIAASTVATSNLGYVSTLQSDAQTQLNAKQPTIVGAASSVTTANLTADRVVISDPSGKIAAAAVTSTELATLSGITSNVQAQLDTKQPTIVGAASSVVTANLSASKVAVSDAQGKLVASSVGTATLDLIGTLQSDAQTQLNAKQPTIIGAASTVTTANLSVDRVVISNTSGKIASAAVTSTELATLSGISGNVQAQLNTKQPTIVGAASSVVTANLSASKVAVSDAQGKLVASSVGTATLDLIGTLQSDAQTQLNAKQATIVGGASSITTANLVPGLVLVSDNDGKVGVTPVSAASVLYVSTLTGDAQTQLDSKQPTITGAASTVTTANLAANVVLVSNAAGKIVASAISQNELNTLQGATSNLQAQLNAKQATIVGAASTVTTANLTADRVVISDTNGKLVASSVSVSNLGYVSTLQSDAQTQLDAKQSTLTGAASTVTTANLAANVVLVSNAAGKVVASALDASKLTYLTNVTSDLQTQLDAKASLSGATFTGAVTIQGNLAVSGTTTTIDTQQLSVADPVVVINSGGLDRASGVYIRQPSGPNVAVIHRNANVEFFMTSSDANAVTFDAESFANVRFGTAHAHAVHLLNTTPDRVAILDAASHIVSSDVPVANLVYVQNATSDIQTQLNALQITGAATSIQTANVSPDRVLVSNAAGKVASSTITQTELSTLQGVTSNVQAQLNTKASVTTPLAASRALISDAAGNVVVSSTPSANLAFVDNVTSDIQTQLNALQITGAASSIQTANVSPDRVLVSNAAGKVVASSVTQTELGTLQGVTSNVQAQLNALEITGAATSIKHANLSANSVLVSNAGGKVAAYALDSSKLAYLTNVTSDIQAQLNSTASAITGAASSITTSNVSANAVLVSNASGKVVASSITLDELGTLQGATSNLQAQLNAKQAANVGTADKALVSNAQGYIVASSLPAAQLAYLANVTSDIQAQLNSTASAITGAASSITTSNVSANAVLVSNASGKVVASSITLDELGTLQGATNNLQAQLETKQAANVGTADKALVSNAAGYIVASSLPAAQLAFLANVTSDIQAQLNSAATTITGAASSITTSNLSPNVVLIANASGKVVASSITQAELGTLQGATSNLQAQLNTKATLTTPLVSSRALASDSVGNVVVSSTPSSKLMYLNNVTADIQAQLNALAGGTGSVFSSALASDAIVKHTSLDWTTSAQTAEATPLSLQVAGDGAFSFSAMLLLYSDTHLFPRIRVQWPANVLYASATIDIPWDPASPDLLTYTQNQATTADSQPALYKYVGNTNAVYITGLLVGQASTMGNLAIALATSNATPLTLRQGSYAQFNPAGNNAILTGERVLVSEANGRITTSSVSTTTLAYLANVTADIQDQLNATASAITGAASTITTSNLTTSRALVSDGAGKVAVSAVNAANLVYVANLTSDAQTQLNAKADTITGAASSVVTSNLTASRALVSDGAGKVAVSTVTAANLVYVANLTSDAQTQLNAITRFRTPTHWTTTSASVQTTPLSLSASGAYAYSFNATLLLRNESHLYPRIQVQWPANALYAHATIQIPWDPDSLDMLTYFQNLDTSTYSQAELYNYVANTNAIYITGLVVGQASTTGNVSVALGSSNAVPLTLYAGSIQRLEMFA
jgi:hypothetical protein